MKYSLKLKIKNNKETYWVYRKIRYLPIKKLVCKTNDFDTAVTLLNNLYLIEDRCNKNG